jgi:RNA polymerase sigma-70 factor (ECF subfamily)
LDEQSDISLIECTLEGNQQAFEQLVLRYQRRLVGSLQHLLGDADDALDVAQQTFLLAWSKLSSFRGESAFYSWLYRIARNVAHSEKRRSRIQTSSLEYMIESGGSEPVGAATPSHAGEADEHIEAVRNALMQIPEEFRQPLILKEIDGLSYDEIHSILGIPTGTVRSRIFRARQELAVRLKRELRDDG